MITDVPQAYQELLNTLEHMPYLNVILGEMREIYRVPWPVTFHAGPVMLQVYLLTASVA